MRKFQDVNTNQPVMMSHWHRWSGSPGLVAPTEPGPGRAWVWQAPCVLGSQVEAWHVWYDSRYEIGTTEHEALHRIGIRELL